MSDTDKPIDQIRYEAEVEVTARLWRLVGELEGVINTPQTVSTRDDAAQAINKAKREVRGIREKESAAIVALFEKAKDGE